MIQVRNLTKAFSGVCILDNVNVDLAGEETLIVLGPSGSGKTTLLRLMAGFELPDHGVITIDGKVVNALGSATPPNQRNLSLIFQDLALWPHMDAFAHVAFALNKKGMGKREIQDRVDDILDEVSLSGFGKRFPHQLSGGEKQRLALGRALAAKPRYLFMDEPFSSLDPILKRQMLNLTLRLRDTSKIGILYVTHDFDEAIQLADRIALMRKGVFIPWLDKTELQQMTRDELIALYLRAFEVN